MTTRRRLAAACLLLAAVFPAAACGMNAAGEPAEGAVSSPATGTGPPAPAVGMAPEFDRPFAYPGGLSVTVSAPRSFTPSSTASPRFEHGVSFELTVLNGTDQAYPLSRLTLASSVNGEPGEEIVDSTQGYPGLTDTGTELPPSRTVTVLVAFGARDWPSDATLRVRTGPKERLSAEFSGPVSG